MSLVEHGSIGGESLRPASGVISVEWHALRIVMLGSLCLTLLLAGCGKEDASKEGNVLHNELSETPPYEPHVVPYVEPLAPPAREGMSAAQIKFWEYLEQFNRLPDDASEEAIAIYNAKGIAPIFDYLRPSDESVLGDIVGLEKHRELFPERYPWVNSLTKEYEINIPISESRFRGSAEAIGNRYSAELKKFRGWENRKYSEKEYVEAVLEGLLVVDYVYAKGTESDRDAADDIWRGVFTAFYMAHAYEEELADKLIIPATRDIGWAAIASYPEKMWGETRGMLLSGFRLHAPVERIKLAKWMIVTDGIPGKDSSTGDSLYWGLMHNWRMEAGLREYCIYVAHCREEVRPPEEPWGQVVKNVFRITYGKDFKSKYKEYKRLLDAAYPLKP